MYLKIYLKNLAIYKCAQLQMEPNYKIDYLLNMQYCWRSRLFWLIQTVLVRWW